MARPLKGWQRRFEDAIVLADGRELATLEDAAVYIQKLPKAEHDQAHWQFAVAMLINAAEREPAWVLFARMAFMKALHYGEPKPLPARRKKPAKQYQIMTARPAR